MPSIREALGEAGRRLQSIDSERSLLEARLLLGHVLNSSSEDLLMRDEIILTNEQNAAFETLISRRLQYEPIAYLLGFKEFYGLRFAVNSNVLIPRPETENLVEGVLKWIAQTNMKSGSILDLGTGSGCIALSLAKNLPTTFEITGVDISEKALKIAEQNRLNLKISNVKWLRGDMLHPGRALLLNEWDVIVSNPPYIPSREIESLQRDVREYEPLGALDGGEDGKIFLKALDDLWKPRLKKPGFLAREALNGEVSFMEVSS